MLVIHQSMDNDLVYLLCGQFRNYYFLSLFLVGTQFIGEVANPHEMLLFSKKSKYTSRAIEGAIGYKSVVVDSLEDDGTEKIRIEDLVVGSLEGSNKRLTLLPEIEMAKVTQISHII